VDGRGNIFFGYAGNLSASGMFISTVNPKRPGEQFALVFKIPGTGGEIAVTAEVIWVREHDPKSALEPGMGIRFLEISEEAVRQIRSYVSAGKDALE
jgi:uncharacterized protein (TIGR02266 family)